MGKTFGETLTNATSGIKGTILAACMGWLLYTISPRDLACLLQSGFTASGGYTEGNDEVFWLGVIIGAIYAACASTPPTLSFTEVCAVMLLNLQLSLQMCLDIKKINWHDRWRSIPALTCYLSSIGYRSRRCHGCITRFRACKSPI